MDREREERPERGDPQADREGVAAPPPEAEGPRHIEPHPADQQDRADDPRLGQELRIVVVGIIEIEVLVDGVLKTSGDVAEVPQTDAGNPVIPEDLDRPFGHDVAVLHVLVEQFEPADGVIEPRIEAIEQRDPAQDEDDPSLCAAGPS